MLPGILLYRSYQNTQISTRFVTLVPVPPPLIHNPIHHPLFFAIHNHQWGLLKTAATGREHVVVISVVRLKLGGMEKCMGVVRSRRDEELIQAGLGVSSVSRE